MKCPNCGKIMAFQGFSGIAICGDCKTTLSAFEVIEILLDQIGDANNTIEELNALQQQGDVV